MIRIFAIYILLASRFYAAPSIPGIVYYDSGGLYTLDPQTGQNATVFSSLFPTVPAGFTFSDNNTIFVADLNDMNVFRIDINSGATTLLSASNLPDRTCAVELANNKLYVAVENGTVYTLSSLTAASEPELLTSVPGALFADLAILNNTIAIVPDYNSNTIYSVNLQSGAYQAIGAVNNSTAFGIQGICIQDNNTAYTINNASQELSIFDLNTGANHILGTAPSANPQSLLQAGDILYTAINTSSFVASFNLSNSQFVLYPSLGVPNAVASPLQIATTSELTGNNLSLANYINQYGPVDVIRTIAYAIDSSAALYATAPTRNATVTFASQNAFLAASQTLSDHLERNRVHSRQNKMRKMTAGPEVAQFSVPFSNESFHLTENEEPSGLLFASHQMDNQSSAIDSTKSNIQLWLTPFGEYATEHAQNQTPAFQLGLGGAVIGCDAKMENGSLVGAAAAFAYTRVSQDDNMGNANVNQGFLNLYGEVTAQGYYFDLGLWGGYYRADNQRNILFSGFNQTAESNISGWQLAPHFEIGYAQLPWPASQLSWFGIQPFTMIDWVANWESPFQESGASSFAAGSFNMGQTGRFCSFLRTETGLRFYEIIRLSGGTLIVREKGSYAYQKMFNTGVVKAYLVGSPGTFTFNTLTGAQNLGVLELSALYNPQNSGYYFDFRYQGEFGAMYLSQQGSIEIGYSF